MPYKDKAKQNEAMKRLQAENRQLAKRAKELLGIPLDRRLKNPTLGGG